MNQKQNHCISDAVTATVVLRFLIDEKIYRYSHLLTGQNLAVTVGLSGRSAISRIRCSSSPNLQSLYRIAQGIYLRIVRLPGKKEEALLFLHSCAECVAQAVSSPNTPLDPSLMSEPVCREYKRLQKLCKYYTQ